MGDVIHISGCLSASDSLRNIADAMDEGTYPDDGATVIVGSEVFRCGEVFDGRAAEQAIFNMTFGIHKLMNAVFDNN